MGTTAIKPFAIVLGLKFMVQKNPNLANAMTDGHTQSRQHTFTGLFHPSTRASGQASRESAHFGHIVCHLTCLGHT